MIQRRRCRRHCRHCRHCRRRRRRRRSSCRSHGTSRGRARPPLCLGCSASADGGITARIALPPGRRSSRNAQSPSPARPSTRIAGGAPLQLLRRRHARGGPLRFRASHPPPSAPAMMRCCSSTRLRAPQLRLGPSRASQPRARPSPTPSPSPSSRLIASMPVDATDTPPARGRLRLDGAAAVAASAWAACAAPPPPLQSVRRPHHRSPEAPQPRAAARRVGRSCRAGRR